MTNQDQIALDVFFLDYIYQWEANLPPMGLKEAFPQPDQAAVLSVDVINGFCYEGPLASPRVAQIVDPIQALFRAAWAHGVHHLILIQDTHDPEAVEFNQWPPHCVRGTSESEAVPEFKELPFYNEMVTIPKNSIQSILNTGLSGWLADHPEINTFVVVGDCTDLCTYQLAMHLRLDANARNLRRRVIVPANCVDTFDIPIETAHQLGVMPHPGNLLHAVFLYNMAQNGVEVVASIRPDSEPDQSFV